VKVVHAAVSNISGSVNLYISPGHSNHSLNPGYTDYQDTITVPATTVDDHLRTLGNPEIDFVKLDVEGSEVRVLQGMEHTISRSPNLMMIVELNPRALPAGGYTPEDLLGIIQSYGFKPREITARGKLVDPFDNQSDETRNLLCLKSE